jgi:D-beta-D-heptose 7-phosphate kinase/D-beta-D-heptose 1-phosphate adenosyltransferase
VGTSADSATGVLRALCAEQDISTQHLVESAAPITSKNRLISMHQQVARFDEDHVVVPDDITRTRLIEQLTAVRKRTNVVVISDYGYNTADRGLIEAVLELWKDGIVIQDPQSHRPNDYTGVHGTTPNRGEAAYLLGESHVPPNTDEAAADTCKRLKEKLKLRFVLLTRSEKGMTLLDEQNELHHFPALARQLADVSGAGDTVIATLASAFAVNMSLVDAVRYANAAGAVSVAKPGVARVSWDELREELLHTGSNTPAEAVRLVRVK